MTIGFIISVIAAFILFFVIICNDEEGYSLLGFIFCLVTEFAIVLGILLFEKNNFKNNISNMEKINLVELLKDCPEGMELDCTMYDNMHFDEIVENARYPIACYTIHEGIRTSIHFTEYGTFNIHGNSKCVIFPKGKTTWEGFKPTNIKYEVTYGFGKDLTVKAFNEEEFKHFIDIAVCNNKDIKDFTVNMIIPD